MNIGGYNNFIGNKGAKINKQLLILKSIYETNFKLIFDEGSFLIYKNVSNEKRH